MKSRLILFLKPMAPDIYVTKQSIFLEFFMYFDFVTTTNSRFICNQRTDIVLRVLYKVFSGTVKVNDECLQNSFTNHATQQISHLQLLFSISRFISFYDVITKLEKMHAILFVTFCKNCFLSLFQEQICYIRWSTFHKCNYKKKCFFAIIRRKCTD